MMDHKVLVEIHVPVSGEKFDVFLPLDTRMSDVILMVCSVINELSAGKFRAGKDAVLCNADTGIIYNVNITVAELEIQNGSRLMLI